MRLPDGCTLGAYPALQRFKQDAMAISHSEAVARAWVLVQPIVDAFISSAVRNRADAQDILQDVAVAILDGHSLPMSDRDFTAWSIGIARHKIADHFRRKSHRHLVMGDEVLQDVADAFAAHADAWTAEGHALEHCLDRVKGDAKHLLHLRYRDGHSPQEIAHRLGRTSEAIRASLLRVRRALRECIERRLGHSRGLTASGGD
jgi:RNA polymerase sigma-70 factor (ECF subfamily)